MIKSITNEKSSQPVFQLLYIVLMGYLVFNVPQVISLADFDLHWKKFLIQQLIINISRI